MQRLSTTRATTAQLSSRPRRTSSTIPPMKTLLVAPRRADLRVSFAEVPPRSPNGIISVGYEQIRAVHFAIDPEEPVNGAIVIRQGAEKCRRSVEFSADLLTMWPKTGDGNHVALVDVVNRGTTTAFRLNRTAGANLVGDGFLMKQGFMIICIGWEFDVAARNGVIRINVPVATENGATITGTVRAPFTPDRRDHFYADDVRLLADADDPTNATGATSPATFTPSLERLDDWQPHHDGAGSSQAATMRSVTRPRTRRSAGWASPRCATSRPSPSTRRRNVRSTRSASASRRADDSCARFSMPA